MNEEVDVVDDSGLLHLKTLDGESSVDGGDAVGGSEAVGSGGTDIVGDMSGGAGLVR